MCDTFDEKSGNTICSFSDRKRSVQKVLDGESVSFVAKEIGVHRTSVYRWLNAYREGGDDALKAMHEKIGRPKGSAKVNEALIFNCLSKESEQRWVTVAIGKRKLVETGEFFWTIDLLVQHLREEHGIEVTGAWVRRILHKIGVFPLPQPLPPEHPGNRVWHDQVFKRLQYRIWRKRGALYQLTSSPIRSPDGDALWILLVVTGMGEPVKLRITRANLKGRDLVPVLEMLDDKRVQFRNHWAWRREKAVFVVPEDAPVPDKAPEHIEIVKSPGMRFAYWASKGLIRRSKLPNG